MADFFTPKRIKRMGSGGHDIDSSNEVVAGSTVLDQTTNSVVMSDVSDIAPLLQDDDEFERNIAMTSWRKLRKRVRVARRGSVLHRNSERGDHLRSLFLKRRITDAIMSSMTATTPNGESTAATSSDDVLQATIMKSDTEGFELSVPLANMDIMSKWDESFIMELRAEIELEMNTESESAKIREVNNICKDYQECLKGYNEFPLEVRLENVSYIVPVDRDKQKIMTVYNASCLYPAAQTVRRFWKGERKPDREVHSKQVISNISLILKPGKQYLVLGPPRSGKSTLLRSIAGLVHPKKDERMEGNISYNGRTLKESDEFHIKNAFAYIDQLDKHAPRLTVEETFEFAYQCSTGGKFVREKLAPDVEEVMKKADKVHLATRLTLAGLGLTEVKDTFVGDAEIRGVSGGQRRRVTVGEMLMSRAPVLCGDEISTGLDAASTFDMIQVILYSGRSRKQTGIFSLLQPSPETVSLFDDVIVMAEGQVIYAGPIEDVEDYFANIGFQSPEFTDVADFLQMVSTEDGASLYKPDRSIKALYPNPPTASELAGIFRGSDLGVAIVSELHSPPTYAWNEIEGSQHGAQISKLAMSDAVRKRYANRFPRSTQLILRRFIVLWLRDKRVIIAGAVKNILMGVSVGGVFFSTDDELSIQGALFQAGLFIMLGAMQSASGLLQDRIIYYKHTGANFYSAWPFVFGRTLSQMPQTTADTVTFASILYYMIGLADRVDITNFFTYLAILVTFAVLMNTQLALFASFATGSQVQVYSSCTLLAMMLFGGFIIPPDAIPDYYLWAYWWNPFAWAYRALIVNEFRSARWEDPDQVLSDAGFVDPEGIAYGEVWVGYSFLFMGPYLLLCCVLSAIGLTYVHHTGSVAPDPAIKGASMDNDAVTEKMEIPFKPVTLSFHDICYEVTASTTKEQLSLLKSVNGIFRPGQMCALMGSSGAGKTTLMDVIALRKRSGTIAGEVRLNGWLQDPIAFRRCSGYVEQFDVQSPELTVRETVLFSARLRLDSDLVETDEKKQAFVDHIIEEVELTDLTHSLVGTDEGMGLSFEQKKRLSIAVELAASPSIIFLDEPTSGLDARSASLVVKTLRRIADGKRTVCATIHQPSSAVFGMFDELLLLKKGGHVVYHGPLGDNCSSLVSYFESRGAPTISLGENPANWMLRVITAEEQKDLADTYLQSKEFSSLRKELDNLKESPAEDLKIVYESEFATSGERMRELVNRRLQLIYWRSPTYNLARVMISLIIACILGSVFIFSRDIAVYTEVDMQARLSVVFIAFIITGIMAMLSVLPVMTKIRDMFYRHRDAGMYNSYAMGLALGVAEKSFILVSTALFCSVFLAISGLGNDFSGMIGFWGFFTFNFAIYSYMGQLFVCLVKPTATAIILCSIFIGLNNFFAGLIVRPQFMVGGFYALPFYICPGHYVYESMVTAIYNNDERPVMANDGSDFYNYLAENEINDCYFGATDCMGTKSQYVDVFFGFEYTIDHRTRNAIILGFVLVLSRIFTWVALKYIRFAS